MKNRIVKTIVTVVSIALLAGCNSISAVGHSTADSTTASSTMAAVSRLCRMDSVEMYFTCTQDDYDAMTDVLAHRNGKIIIKVIEATVLDDDGNASDQFGFYVKYDSERFSKGDKVKSVFIYNPDTNYLDDILYRSDVLIE